MKRMKGELTALTADLAIHQKLADEPNDEGGLTAEEMKEKFDAAGLAIQEYLNETHLPEVQAALEETLKEAEQYADEKVVAIGGGDMAMAIYDTQGLERDIYRYAEEIAKKVLGDREKFGYICVGESASRQYKGGSSLAKPKEGATVDLRGLWSEEEEAFVMPETAKGVLVTLQVRWARQSFARCRVKLLKDGEEASCVTGPEISNGDYVWETLLLCTEVSGGEKVQVELEVESSSGDTGDINAKFMKVEILL